MFAFPSGRKVREDLLGSPTATPIFDLPSGLQYFVENLPPGAPYSVDTLINNHTLLLYYEPFLGLEKAALARETMAGPPRQGLHRLLNVTGAARASPSSLQFCRECYADDIERFGFSYWRRIHQLPGVFVCDRHECSLAASKIARRNRTNRHYFYPLTGTVAETGVKLDIPLVNFEHLLKIARDTAFLLSERIGPRCEKDNRELYQLLLRMNDWVDSKGRPAWNVLEKRFIEHFGANLLEALEIRTTNFGTGNSWISNIFFRKRLHSPLRHLLLMQFLGVSAEQFFALDSNSVAATKLGVKGNITKLRSAPCRNPLCPKYDSNFRTTVKTIENTGLVVGIKCPACGYTYEAVKSNTRICILKDPGEVWIAHFRALAKRSNASWSLAARELGVRRNTLKRFAIRLEIDTSRLDQFLSKGKPISQEVREQRFRKRRRQRRTHLLEILDDAPDISRSAIAKQFPSLYKWFKRNDADWFENNAPLKKGFGESKIDWKKRDLNLAARVGPAVTKILKNPGCSRRITFTLLAGGIWSGNAVKFNAHKLPLTINAITENLETLEEYQLRCIEWSAEQFVEEKIVPSPYMLARRARFPSQRQARVVADLEEVCSQVERDITLP